MDLMTHILITRKFVNKEPRHILAGMAPDAPFYLTYPAWVASQGKLQDALVTNDWPDPPRWMEEAHHAFHSLPVLAGVALLVRLVTGKWPRNFILAWGLHILIDIPTHSRRR